MYKRLVIDNLWMRRHVCDERIMRRAKDCEEGQLLVWTELFTAYIQTVAETGSGNSIESEEAFHAGYVPKPLQKFAEE